MTVGGGTPTKRLTNQQQISYYITMKMAPILSLAQLRTKALKDPNYRKLAILAAESLGGDPGEDLNKALDWLNTIAIESSEEGVIEEVNFCRDLL